MAGQAAETQRSDPEGASQARVAGVGQDRQTAEPRQVGVAGACALNEEVEDDGHREPGEIQTGADVAEYGRDVGVNEGNISRNNGREERTLSG